MRKIALITVALFFLAYKAQAFEAAVLHEEADNTEIQTVLEEVASSSGSFDSLYKLALVYLNLYEEEKAFEVFNKLTALDPGRQEPKWGVAEVLRRRHKLDEAVGILTNIISNSPDFSPAYISLAYIKFTKYDFKGCLTLASKVIKQGRQNVDLTNFTRAYLLVAGARGMLAYYGGPIAKISNGNAIMPNLKRARQLKPDYAGVWFGFGTYYLLAPKILGGDNKKAISFIEKAIKKDPDFADAYARLAQAYKATGDEKKYDYYLEKALSVDPLNELAKDIKSGRCRFVCERSPDT